MAASFKEILDAFEFANVGGFAECSAYVCKQTGKIFLHSEHEDAGFEDALPDDIEDEQKYLALPDKRELDLGKPLVLAFTRQILPDDFNEVRRIFSRRGAYAAFKDLLARRRALDQWYEFERDATERALRQWCQLNSIELVD
jgi:hypothetical protein